MRSFLLLLLLACPAWAAPPTLKVAEATGEVGDFITITAETTGKTVGFKAIGSGLKVFPAKLLTDPKSTVVTAAKAGTYQMHAVTCLGDELSEIVVVTVKVKAVGDGGDTKPADPPTKPGDPSPPAKPAASLYFLIVRSDAPAAPAFTKTMSLPAWDELRAAGHTVKDKTLTEAAKIGWSPPDGTTLPAVLTLQNSANGLTSKIVKPFADLPTTNEAIRSLPTIPKGN